YPSRLIPGLPPFQFRIGDAMFFTLSRSSRLWIVLAATVLIISGYALLALAADAGGRSNRTLGGPLPGLTPLETVLFNEGARYFGHSWTPKQGLGPVFLRTSCVGCHSEPVGGGNSAQQVTLFQGGNTAAEGGPYLQRIDPKCRLGNAETIPP